MIGFMTFLKEGDKYIGGYLGTDDELSPVEFSFTQPIPEATILQKILYGAKFDQKWFGDLIAGTLFEGIQKKEDSNKKNVDIIFVSDNRMLYLRRKTAEVPVVYINDNGEKIFFEKRDHQIADQILKNIDIEYSNTTEVFTRIVNGIKEAMQSVQNKDQ